MPRLQRKSFANPDQVRTFPSGHIDVIRLDEVTIGRFVLQPGCKIGDLSRPVYEALLKKVRALGGAVVRINRVE